MKTIAVLAIFLGIAFAMQTHQQFRDFQKKYNKVYAAEEFPIRYTNFKDNLAKAEKLTALNGGSAKFGVTQFSDLSEEEFAAKYLIKNFDTEAQKAYPVKTDFSAKGKVAHSCNPDKTNFDWTSCGAVTPVKNQEQCGSCWAFSATETIESYWILSGHSMVELSPQQIVSCDTAGQDEGCNGGYTTGAYSYVQSAGGLETEAAYPYTSGNGESGSCLLSNQTKTSFVANVASVQTISGETGLYQQTSTANGGPVSICVDASTWQTYQGGVLTSCPSNIDHCVQLVGYANYGQTGAYWIVRNSWGPTWGESGHIWVAIGQDLCAIGDSANVVTTSDPSA